MPPQYYFLAEVTDEFAPDTPEDTFENRIEAEAPAEVKAELYSICDSNHWVHLFSDQDVKVECILTEQVNYPSLFFFKSELPKHHIVSQTSEIGLEIREFTWQAAH